MAKYEVKRIVTSKQWVVIDVEVPEHLLKSGNQELISDYVTTYAHLNAGAYGWEISDDHADRKQYTARNLDTPSVAYPNPFLGDAVLPKVDTLRVLPGSKFRGE